MTEKNKKTEIPIITLLKLFRFCLIYSRFFNMIRARVELYILSLLVIVVTKLNLSVGNLTILAMVKEHHNNVVPKMSDENICNKSGNWSENVMNLNSTKFLQDYGGSLEWSDDVQFLFLTSPYISYIVSQIFGGYATYKFGTRNLISCSLLAISLCNVLISFGSKLHYIVAILLQLVQGFAQGLVWPGLYDLIAYWIPINERCRFVSCFQGGSIGTMLSEILPGLITSSIGWEHAFGISSILGLVICLPWYLLVRNAPELHPRISMEELNYIVANRGKPCHKNTIPWKCMICSLPLWVIVISAFGRMWITTIIEMYGPSYLKRSLGLDAQTNGIYSGIIYFASYISSLIFAYIADKLAIRDVVKLLTNRKLLTAVGQVPPSLLMILMVYIHCQIPALLTVWAILQLLLSANGATVNVVDVTPNFAAPAISLVNIVSTTPRIFATLFVKFCTQHEVVLDACYYMFIIAGAINLISYVPYLLFASCEVQTWNNVAEETAGQSEETKLLDK
ncbi:hypothetical protein RI129_009590 [Pyrocoelia pectoralis]|uniref:Major facilitator superfamily (MFS) profile domain-containing protein n=1 Tax=Pyrocoelia pectoralis TaxID=417401 RepID=A0AAN7V8P5_9COLE